MYVLVRTHTNGVIEVWFKDEGSMIGYWDVIPQAHKYNGPKTFPTRKAVKEYVKSTSQRYGSYSTKPIDWLKRKLIQAALK